METGRCHYKIIQNEGVFYPSETSFKTLICHSFLKEGGTHWLLWFVILSDVILRVRREGVIWKMYDVTLFTVFRSESSSTNSTNLSVLESSKTYEKAITCHVLINLVQDKGFWYIVFDIVRKCQILLDIVKCCQISSIVKLSDIVKYCQILSNIVWYFDSYCLILSNMDKML